MIGESAKFIAALIFLAVLNGCAGVYQPIPDGYSGPRVTIRDSVLTHSGSKADFFCIEAVDGNSIDNSRIATRQANRGRGMSMTPKIISRELPVRPITLKLVGRTEYAAPILALANTVYEVKGDISFTPEANKLYIVKGELNDSRSAVWIEEQDAGIVSGTKVEVTGSAKLGVLEK
jgi:hypothetical protein